MTKRHYVGCPSLTGGKCNCEFVQAFCTRPPWADEPKLPKRLAKALFDRPDLWIPISILAALAFVLLRFEKL